MSKENTRAIIDANIRQNGQQLITGPVLNATLKAMVTDYAEQGALNNLEEKVNALALGAFYGYFPDSSSLPTDATTPGYAYVGEDNPYAIWNFNGEEWSDSGISIDMNDADEEDITRNADGKLQFKDRDNTDGMGYVILRKDKTFAEQVTASNTIYEIRYDFDLNGQTATIPQNCILLFDGGCLENGVLKGTDSSIIAGDVQIFKQGVLKHKGYKESGTIKIADKIFNSDISIIGTWKNTHVNLSWFGISGNNETRDCSAIINNYFNLFDANAPLYLPYGVYGLFNPITIDREFDGHGCIFKACSLANAYSDDIDIPSSTTPLIGTDYPYGLEPLYSLVIMSGDQPISNFVVDGSNVSVHDYKDRAFGVYGLARIDNNVSYTTIVKNAKFINGYQNNLLGLQHSARFEACEFRGTCEHLVYGRPSKGTISFINCLFADWGVDEQYATKRGEGYSIKIPFSSSRQEEARGELIGCKFVQDSNLKYEYLFNWECDSLNIDGCDFNITPSHMNTGVADKSLRLVVNNCNGIPTNSVASDGIGLFECYNSKGTFSVLNSYLKIVNCELTASYTVTMDLRNESKSDIADVVRNLYVENTKLIARSSANLNSWVTGAYYITFKNVDILSYDSNNTTQLVLTFFTNASNTPIEGVNPKLELDSCRVDFKRSVTTGIAAVNFDIVYKDGVYSAYNDASSGYLNRTTLFRSGKSLTIINSEILPSTNGTIPNLYYNTIPATYVSDKVVAHNSESSKGVEDYNYTANKKRVWDGSQWKEFQYASSGTTSKRPTATIIGEQYFDITLEKPIYWTGTKWVDAMGADA